MSKDVWECVTVVKKCDNTKNSCRFKNFQEYPRFCERLGYSRKILNLHGLLDFLVKACLYWPLAYTRISLKFKAYS